MRGAGSHNHWHHRRIPDAGTVYDTLLDRARRSDGFRAWMQQEWEATPQEWDPDDIDDQAVRYLEDELELTAQGESGYPAPRYLDPESQRLLERLPFELHHATSSEILELIEEQGQLRGARAEHQITDEQYSSAAGLYLSSDFGHAFGHYGEIAEDRWGGEAVAITVLVFTDELQPDPDDANLGSGRHQWITPSLPVSRIVRVYPSEYDRGRRGSRSVAPSHQRFVVKTEKQGLDLIRSKVYTDNWRRSLGHKPAHDVAVLVPCAGTKPFSEAPSHKHGYMPALDGLPVDRWVVAEPLGVVPWAWEQTWPNDAYDYPPSLLKGAARKLLVERIRAWFTGPGRHYRTIFLALPGHHGRLVRDAVEGLDLPLVDVSITACRGAKRSCGASSFRATSQEYRRWLRRKVQEGAPKGSRAMAPGYRSWAWTKQDWRSVIPKKGGKVDFSKKCGAKGTKTRRGTPALCLPREICERLSASASGRRILHDQANKKWRAKQGERVPWHPRIRELHRELEARTPRDRKKPR